VPRPAISLILPASTTTIDTILSIDDIKPSSVESLEQKNKDLVTNKYKQ
jgi:hypothetical protein